MNSTINNADFLNKYVTIIKSNNPYTNGYKGYKGFVKGHNLSKNNVFVLLEANGIILSIDTEALAII